MAANRLGWILAAALTTATAAVAAPASPPAGSPTPFAQAVDGAKAAMMSVPDTALVRARAAGAFAASEPAGSARELDTATALWLQGEALTRVQRPREALPLLDRALGVAMRAAPGSKLHGDVLKSRGRARAAMGEVQAALSDLQAAFAIFQAAHQARSAALALQEIGIIYSDARDDARVLSYFAQAAEVYHADPALDFAQHNSRGFALQHLGRLPEAEAEFERALGVARGMGAPPLQAQVLTNLASVQILQGRKAAAAASLGEGLRLTAQNREAAAEEPFLFALQAKLRLGEGRTDDAVRLVDRAVAGVDPRTSPKQFRDLHEIAYEVYDSAGRAGDALTHLRAFKRLDDQGRALAASTNAALMAARFDFANQDARIARLKAGQLERDVALAGERARQHQILLLAVLAVTGAVLGAAAFGYVSMRRSRDRLRAVNVELEAALQAKTAFLAATSHEIRTPLNGMMGMTQVILAKTDLPPDVRERLELVRGAGDTMKALVDDLLDTAKAETGVVTLEPRPFDPSELFRDALGFWRDKAQAKGLVLALELGELPPRVVADPGRLRQLVFNLTNNAIKFTERGEVVLRAAAHEGRLVLSVSDTGVGIAAADQARIFDAFVQVDNGTSRRFGGTGLGLTICRNICRAMGGELAVESAAGRGSVFTARLPLVAAEVAAPAPAAAEARGGLEGAAVLVVEPNPLNQSILKAVLAPAVRSLTLTAAVADARGRLADAAVDAMVVDLAALRREEDAAAALFSLHQAHPTAPILVTRPAAEAGLDDALLAAGAAAVLARPVPPPALLAALQQAFAGEASARSFASAA